MDKYKLKPYDWFTERCTHSFLFEFEPDDQGLLREDMWVEIGVHQPTSSVYVERVLKRIDSGREHIDEIDRQGGLVHTDNYSFDISVLDDYDNN